MNSLVKTQQTMSSTQLLELLHFDSKSSLNKKIRSMFQGKIDDGILESSKDSRGYVVDYFLPEKESKMFVAKHDIDYLEKVIQFWINKDRQPALPNTFAEALQLAANQAKEIEEKQKQLELKDQLIIASNEASIKAGDIKVSEFCKSTDIVDLGRNQMYDWMREQGYLFKGSREPIQEYVKRGFFKWLPSKDKHGGKIRYTLFITARGKVWLAARYMAYLDNELDAA